MYASASKLKHSRVRRRMEREKAEVCVLGVCLARAWLADDLAAFEILFLHTTKKGAEVVAGLPAAEDLAKHFHT
jgi:hypothetical protein